MQCFRLLALLAVVICEKAFCRAIHEKASTSTGMCPMLGNSLDCDNNKVMLRSLGQTIHIIIIADSIFCSSDPITNNDMQSGINHHNNNNSNRNSSRQRKRNNYTTTHTAAPLRKHHSTNHRHRRRKLYHRRRRRRLLLLRRPPQQQPPPFYSQYKSKLGIFQKEAR